MAGAKAPAIFFGARPGLLGSNQDSPDPEEPQEHPELQQLATIYATMMDAKLTGASMRHSCS